MEFSFSSLVPLLASILLILLTKKLLTRRGKKVNLPPGPWKLPIIGSLHHLMGEHVHRRLKRLAGTYGPLFHLKLGEVDLMVISSPELAAESMRTHDLSFANRPQFMGSRIIMYNSGDIVFAPYGKLWAQLRKICTVELFSASRVKRFRSVMGEEGENLVRKIQSAKGAPVNMTDLLLSVANTIISRTSFGKECAQQDRIFSAVKDTFRYMSGFDLADLFPSYRFLGEINGMRRHLEKVHRVLDDTLNEVFDEHQARGRSADSDDEDLVDVLLRLKSTGGLDASVSMDNLKGVIVDLILGGTETTSAIMEWVMAELIRHPEIMQKAQKEVREAFAGKSEIDESDIIPGKLPYLSMVMKETLRVRPPAPILVPRYCSETVEIGGYTVPAGSRLLINAWAIMRDPACWEDAEAFRPERVEESEGDFSASKFQYMPFGGGRRVCPGVAFGVASIEIVLAKLLFSFDWKLPGGKTPDELDMEESVGLALTRKNPLFVVATPPRTH